MSETLVSYEIQARFPEDPMAVVRWGEDTRTYTLQDVEVWLSQTWDGGPYDHLRGVQQREISLFLKLRDLIKKGKWARGDSLPHPRIPGLYVTTAELR